MANTEKAGEMRGTSGGRSGAQESEEAGMDQMSRMLREASEDDDPGMQKQAGTGRGEEGGYVWVLSVRECAMCDRERGMSERERGMAERERAMYDRECAMADREDMSSGGPQGGMDR
jgi:hypothetical protein